MFEILSTCKNARYIYCRTNPTHPKALKNGLYPLHRVLLENKIGRLLNDREVVHHINHNKLDNKIENLELLTDKEHNRLHSNFKDELMVECGWCNKEIYLKPHSYRLRMNRNKYKKIFCCRACGTRYNYSKNNNVQAS